jgi:hypothetical protein
VAQTIDHTQQHLVSIRQNKVFVSDFRLAGEW